MTARYLGKDALDERVMRALAEVPREDFVAAGERDLAYANIPLPIGHGQTISQPYIVAVMTDLVRPEPSDVVLEVGTGSGYQAAVLSRLVRRVYSLEVVQPLAEAAAKRLARLGYDRVEVKWGDGWGGWPEHAPYQAIVVTAAAPEMPTELLSQLAPGGRMILPLGAPYTTQVLVLVEKHSDGRISERDVLPVAFVPMTGGVAEAP
ncbi:MAG: protein-L-isoaspartate(D-aspartate) O-methyltransferase [Alphaproteobacteria bacterium]|nr:protein-L-isoaspartate(D-aspartate) O-methyltransferase [Alphaproteobacteria bacterium]